MVLDLPHPQEPELPRRVVLAARSFTLAPAPRIWTVVSGQVLGSPDLHLWLAVAALATRAVELRLAKSFRLQIRLQDQLPTVISWPCGVHELGNCTLYIRICVSIRINDPSWIICGRNAAGIWHSDKIQCRSFRTADTAADVWPCVWKIVEMRCATGSMVDRVPDRHGDPENFLPRPVLRLPPWLSWIRSTPPPLRVDRPYFKHLQTSSNLSNPQWHFSSLSLQCWISVEYLLNIYPGYVLNNV